MKKPRSTLALACLTLRSSRGLLQVELAESAGVHVSTLKNVEGDKPVSLATLARLYRDGMKGKHRLSVEEWHKLVGYWLLREVPEGIALDALVSGASAAADGVAGAAGERQRAVLAAMAKMPEQDAETLAAVAKALTTRRGPALLAVLRGLLAM